MKNMMEGDDSICLIKKSDVNLHMRIIIAAIEQQIPFHLYMVVVNIKHLIRYEMTNDVMKDDCAHDVNFY